MEAKHFRHYAPVVKRPRSWAGEGGLDFHTNMGKSIPAGISDLRAKKSPPPILLL